MGMAEIQLKIPEEILSSLNQNKKEFSKKSLLYIAFQLYKNGELSIGKAAKLAGFTKLQFIEKMQEKKEFIFDYTSEQMDEIFQDAKRTIK